MVICPHGHNEAVIPRVATPEEVDEGCELGEAYDPCPQCAGIADLDTLLGVPDFDQYDHQAEQGQGPPA